MHIPDGYLSPVTCAVLYGASAPFWYVALRRVKKFLTTRLVPLMSVVAALTFVIMMFNLPLPGGTTGKLHIIARVTAAPRYAAAAGDTTLAADAIVEPDPDPFPRALWAPHAPIPLILTLALALGGVWTTYVFVLTQLRALRKEGPP